MDDKNEFSKILSGIVDATKSITETFVKKGGEFVKDSGLQDLKDYYPFYSWPPLNLYSSKDGSLIFEFGLPGFIKDDVNITFDEDYMLFSAKLSNLYSTGEGITSYKNKLKLSDIKEQKYFVPQDKFDRKSYSMHMKNGLLRVVFSLIE